MKHCERFLEGPSFRQLLSYFIFAGLFQLVYVHVGFDWCDAYTNGCNSEHTMCVYKKPDLGEACRNVNFTTVQITPKIRYALLFFFNRLRNYVAEGLLAGLPKAANMQKLRWNQELALFAQRWANQCTTDASDQWHVTPLDYCRDLEGYSVAQWATRLTGTGDLNIIHVALEHMLELYAGTNEFYDKVIKTGYLPRASGGVILYGATFSYIGCGFSIFTYNESVRVSHLYCNMAPLQLQLTDKYYQAGQPCSQCQPGYSCNKQEEFPSLCQRGRSLIFEDNWYNSLQIAAMGSLFSCIYSVF